MGWIIGIIWTGCLIAAMPSADWAGVGAIAWLAGLWLWAEIFGVPK